MSVKPVFALVDCNNFFVSCERVFRPDLWNKPVAVLSSNDGCIVARSNEVKALGIPMGIPVFKVRNELTAGAVTLFSGNFQLYGDFSQRVVAILRAACPDIEVYSVDESFLELSRLNIGNYEAWARELSKTIFSWTGIPVSVGIASSKTLAKAAADYAKKHADTEGGYAIVADATRTDAQAEAARLQLLQSMAARDIWGVGRQLAPKLQARGVSTAHQLSCMSEIWVQKNMTIRGVKLVRELNGQSCLGLDNNGDDLQHSIARTRSFGHSIRDYYELEGAIATFAAQAAAKLREKGQLAGAVVTFLRTSKHAHVRGGSSQLTTLVPATNDTGTIMAAALDGLRHVYDPDFGYKKGGVLLLNLGSEHARQLSFETAAVTVDRQEALMGAVDALNKKYATRLVRHASEHINRTDWHSRHQLRSKAYTTQWRDLPTVRS